MAASSQIHLYQHQIDAAARLWELRQLNATLAFLANPVGAGKTITLLWWTKELLIAEPRSRIAILVTRNTVHQWEADAERIGLACLVLKTIRGADKKLAANPSVIIVTPVTVDFLLNLDLQFTAVAYDETPMFGHHSLFYPNSKFDVFISATFIADQITNGYKFPERRLTSHKPCLEKRIFKNCFLLQNLFSISIAQADTWRHIKTAFLTAVEDAVWLGTPVPTCKLLTKNNKNLSFLSTLDDTVRQTLYTHLTIIGGAAFKGVVNKVQHFIKCSHVDAAIVKHLTEAQRESLIACDKNGVARELKETLEAAGETIYEDRISLLLLIKLSKERKIRTLKRVCEESNPEPIDWTTRGNPGDETKRRVATIEQDIKNIAQDYKDFEECSICTIPFANMLSSEFVWLDCCHFSICVTCWYKINTSKCPKCRTANTITTTAAPQTVVDSFREIVKSILDRATRTLIFYDRREKQRMTTLSIQGYIIARLTGSVNRRHDIIERYKRGEIQVLIIDLVADIAGMRLEVTSDIICVYTPKVKDYDQIIGRALRAGRVPDFPVNFHTILFG